MNFKKLFLVSSLAFLINTSVVVDFYASELDTTSEAASEQTEEVVYAPVHPTSQEVEEAALTDIVTFNDSKLEQGIADHLGVPVGEITVLQMKTLTTLWLGDENITDITGLEYATNLSTLDLASNYISDISPLTGLTKLEDLTLSSNYNLSDISPLAGLTNLTSLDLAGNEITDISSLAGLTNLTVLKLNNNQIADVTPLTGLTNLTNLNLSNNEITDISSLVGLTNLIDLKLGYNNITDVSPLAGLTNLTKLKLSVNEITDISPLAGLTNLTSLDLGSNRQLSDISPLTGLTNLTNLYLDDDNITDVSPLAGLTNLTYLNLNVNEISDTSPLTGLTNLTTLNLSNNNITDVSPLVELTNLIHLSLIENEISDISPLAGLTNLTTLNVQRQKIRLEDITVYDNSEIYYSVVNIDGTEHQVSLGIPTPGHKNMTGSWSLDAPFHSSLTTEYKGVISQNVTFGDTSTLTGIDTANSNEETNLSDEELITLFEVVSSEGETITVDQSAVDYSTPNDYEVVFNDETGNEFTATLTITDVLPTISSDDSFTITLGETVEDYISAFNTSATEISDGDLNSSVIVDSSNVDLNSTGSYDVIFTVTDNEGNSISTTATLIIEKDLTDIDTINPITSEVDPADPVDSIDSVDPVDSIDSNEVASEDSNDTTSMTLATTGGKIVGTIIGLLVILIVALGLKKVIKEN